jgi:hypothetical protein
MLNCSSKFDISCFRIYNFVTASQFRERDSIHRITKLTSYLLLPSKESLVTDQKDTPPNASLALRTTSIIQLDGGYVNYYSCSGSRKNPRIEVEVKTQCPGELMKKAMEWLAQNTGENVNTHNADKSKLSVYFSLTVLDQLHFI